jgi:hypothetical protein
MFYICDRSGDAEMKTKFRPLIITFIVILALLITKFVLSGSIGEHLGERLRASKSQTYEVIYSDDLNIRVLSTSNGFQIDKSLPDYRTIVEHDLFRPLGWQKTVENPPDPEPVVKREIRRELPVRTNNLVLTGILQLEGESIALVEDISVGEGYFLREGDRLKDYLVEEIAEEDILLVSNDSTIRTALGSITLSEQSHKEAANSVVESPGDESASPDEISPNLSLIEQMKARRRKELEAE